MYKKIAGMLVAAATTIAFGIGIAPTASAVTYLTQSNLSTACQLAHQQLGWSAHLEFPNQGGYGWRCWADYSAVRSGVNIEGYCQVYGPGPHARGGSTAYNWYCDA